MRSVVLVEHAGHAARIYETPCGILTYQRHRQRHDWCVETAGGLSHHGEDLAAACAQARQVGGHVVLLLDGRPLRSGRAR